MAYRKVRTLFSSIATFTATEVQKREAAGLYYGSVSTSTTSVKEKGKKRKGK